MYSCMVWLQSMDVCTASATHHCLCDCALAAGVLIWRYGTTVGARATYSGAKHEISGARAWLALAM